MLKPGDSVPEFELHTTDGERVSVTSLLENGPVLLSFFKVSCPVCQYTFPFLDRMERVIGISQNDAAATLDFAQEFDIDFPLLIDPADDGYKVSNLFRISHVPTSFVLGPDRRITTAFSGFSRRDITEVGARFGAQIFQPGERTPDFKPG